MSFLVLKQLSETSAIAAVEAVQTMNGEPIKSEEVDEAEPEQMGMVLKQHFETSADTLATVDSGPEPIRPVRRRRQTERGREYCLRPRKKGQRRGETRSATAAAVEAVQTMNGEPMTSEEVDEAEADQLGMVLKQQSETSVITVRIGGHPTA